MVLSFQLRVLQQQSIELLLNLTVFALPIGQRSAHFVYIMTIDRIALTHGTRFCQYFIEWRRGLLDYAAVSYIRTGRSNRFSIDPSTNFRAHGSNIK